MKETNQETQTEKRKKTDIISLVIMIVLAVILIPILAINLTLIIKGNVNRDEPPSVFGYAPLAVTSGSMKGDKPDSFDEGALIFIKLLDEEEKQSLKEQEIVCFRVEENGTVFYVTHRIVALHKDAEGKLVNVVTMGDANNVTDGEIAIESVLGKCTSSMAGMGGFTVFLQTPVGIVVFVGIPVLLFIIYDVVRITLYNKKIKAEAAANEQEEALRDKDEEIRRLRAMVEQSGTAEQNAEETAEETEKEAPNAEETEQGEETSSKPEK